MAGSPVDAFFQGAADGYKLRAQRQAMDSQALLAQAEKQVRPGQSYGQAMGLGTSDAPNSQAAMLQAQDNALGGNASGLTAQALNSAAPGSANPANMQGFSQEDAYNQWMHNAASQGLLSPDQLNAAVTAQQNRQLGAARISNEQAVARTNTDNADVSDAEKPGKIDRAKLADHITQLQAGATDILSQAASGKISWAQATAQLAHTMNNSQIPAYAGVSPDGTATTFVTTVPGGAAGQAAGNTPTAGTSLTVPNTMEGFMHAYTVFSQGISGQLTQLNADRTAAQTATRDSDTAAYQQGALKNQSEANQERAAANAQREQYLYGLREARAARLPTGEDYKNVVQTLSQQKGWDSLPPIVQRGMIDSQLKSLFPDYMGASGTSLSGDISALQKATPAPGASGSPSAAPAAPPSEPANTFPGLAPNSALRGAFSPPVVAAPPPLPTNNSFGTPLPGTVRALAPYLLAPNSPIQTAPPATGLMMPPQ